MHFGSSTGVPVGKKSFGKALRLIVVAALFVSTARAQQNTPWPTYGGDPGGQRYSTAAQITPGNVHQLRPAWSFHTHALEAHRSGIKMAAFETTPVLSGDTLYLSTPFDQVIALNAATGQPRWHFDPQLAPDLDAPIFTS